MRHFREKDHIPFAKKFLAPRLCHQINAFRGSACEHDLIATRSAKVVRHTLARFFVGFRRARAQLMQPTMYIRIFMLVIMPQRIEHISRFLRRRGAIKIDQGMTVRLLVKDREIFADGVPIYVATSNLVHTLISSTRRGAPPYSGAAFSSYKIDNSL